MSKAGEGGVLSLPPRVLKGPHALCLTTKGAEFSELVEPMEDDNWDLHAVVRGCTTGSSSTTATTTSTATYSRANYLGAELGTPQSWVSSFGSERVGRFFSLQDPFEARNYNGVGELNEPYKPFFPKSQTLYSPQAAPISPLVSPPLGSVSNEQTQQLKQHQHHYQQQQQSKRPVTSSANSHAHRTKRRKNQQKKICHVPAEAVSSDVWAWRKYGQKPIKGSPYPR